MQTLLSITDIASDIYQSFDIYTNDNDYSTGEIEVNNGDLTFNCEYNISHDYTPYNFKTGDQYEFNIQKVDITVTTVYDNEADMEISVPAKQLRKIEKMFAENLRFNIQKKY